jgi:hypothetical protein
MTPLGLSHPEMPRNVVTRIVNLARTSLQARYGTKVNTNFLNQTSEFHFLVTISRIYSKVHPDQHRQEKNANKSKPIGLSHPGAQRDGMSRKLTSYNSSRQGTV